MARKPRVEFPGALYHVIVRGNNRERVFFLQAEKEKYLDLLRIYKKKYGFKLYAYVVLDNHAHLLIEMTGTPLSKIMQGVQQVYTMYYNEKYDRVGHVFQQRYKAGICQKESYLFTLIRYIHKNPMRAGAAEGLDYEWSSHRHYLVPGKDRLVDVNFVLRQFADKPDEAIGLYLDFMGEETGPENDSIDVTEYYITEEIDNKDEPRAVKKILEFDQVLALVNKISGLPDEIIRSGRRTSDVVAARKLFVYLAYRYCSKKQAEISAYLGVTNSAVTQLLSSFRENGEAKEYLHDLEERIASELQITKLT